MSKKSEMSFSFSLNVMLSISKMSKIDQIHIRAVCYVCRRCIGSIGENSNYRLLFNSNFHLIRSKTLPTNGFELTVPDLYREFREKMLRQFLTPVYIQRARIDLTFTFCIDFDNNS